MIKTWLITASAPICGTDTHYCAFSEENPLENFELYPKNILDEFPFDEITEYLWESYSYLLHLDDEEYESQEEEDEAYDQAYEDWKCDCNFRSDEVSLEDLRDYASGGSKSENDLPEIIYDERE